MPALFDLPLGSPRRKRKVRFYVTREHFRHCDYLASSRDYYRLNRLDMGVFHPRNSGFVMVSLVVVCGS